MTKIQLRRDTAANWSTNNPIPSAREPCFETDTASATKKAYSIMTKSTKNNEYMAHIAMPSNKYVDLILGASGSEPSS